MPKISLDSIKIKDSRLRVKSNVQDLCESLREIGLIHPVVVNHRRELLAGGRRYAAAKRLGWKQIEVNWFDGSDLDQEMVTLDENLIRNEVRGIEWEAACRRRKEIYELKYPETKHGNRYSRSAKSAPLNYSKDLAEKTGLSERTIQLAVQRDEKSSIKIKAERKLGRMSTAQVDAVLSLPEKDQNKLIPVIRNKLPSEVRAIVREVKQDGVDTFLKNQKHTAEIRSQFEICMAASKKLHNALTPLISEGIQFPSVHGVRLITELEMTREKIAQFLEIQSPQKGTKSNG